MKNDQISQTAIMSAYGRAYHARACKNPIFDDALAFEMLPDEAYENISEHLVKGFEFFYGDREDVDWSDKEKLQWVMNEQICPTPIARSRYTEDILDKAIQRGVGQYVILGAGLDSFAFRNHADIKVFEVDHPATQAMKTNRINTLGWEKPDSLAFIPCDFSSQRLEDCLLKSNYKVGELSFFSWLGVSYYLSNDEILTMLKSLSSLMEKGSSLVFDYPDEFLFEDNQKGTRVEKMVSLAHASGESMKSSFSYSELESILEEAGFSIYEHLTPKEIDQRYFQDREVYMHAFESINYCLAVKNVMD